MKVSRRCFFFSFQKGACIRNVGFLSIYSSKGLLFEVSRVNFYHLLWSISKGTKTQIRIRPEKLGCLVLNVYTTIIIEEVLLWSTLFLNSIAVCLVLSSPQFAFT